MSEISSRGVIKLLRMSNINKQEKKSIDTIKNIIYKKIDDIVRKSILVTRFSDKTTMSEKDVAVAIKIIHDDDTLPDRIKEKNHVFTRKTFNNIIRDKGKEYYSNLKYSDNSLLLIQKYIEYITSNKFDKVSKSLTASDKAMSQDFE